MMITLYKSIYNLEVISKQHNGEMFKHETLFNFVMTELFSKTGVGRVLEENIKAKMQGEIEKTKKKIGRMRGKGIGYFGVPKEFILSNTCDMSMNIN